MADRAAVLVTGSRDWTDYGPIRERLALYPQGTILLHGNCGESLFTSSGNYIPDWRGRPTFKGADKIAHSCAPSYGFYQWPLPYFADLGRAGGPKRNVVLVNVLTQLWRGGFACFVEGFPIGDSPGTRGCLRLAMAESQALRRDRAGGAWSFCITEGKRDG